jgi:hypothetical protein
MNVFEDCRDVPVGVADEVELPAGYGGVAVAVVEVLIEKLVNGIVGDVPIGPVLEEFRAK